MKTPQINQITCESLHNSKVIVVSDWRPTGVPEFYPSKEHLQKLQDYEISNLRLTAVLYDPTYMQYVSFKFSNGMLSPKSGTYLWEPKQCTEIPSQPDSDLAEVLFQTYKVTNFYLYGLTFNQRNGESLSLMPQDFGPGLHHTTETLRIQHGQRIVSASVLVNDSQFYPCKIAFLLYDFI